ncbi:probable beta-hexosaminidase fdl [Ostrinia furnacalis]|uniref:probable beta-hexosaminidase fdl n=1 Tax=Ostrinia furnacalis TaxID=93504 RepID=UPI00103B5BA5|nr:probable beta-hexosaminidase fdl [Ostrinia furnacalis]
MSTDEASCSDCKIEIIDRKWTQLLLNWINRCVSPKTKVRQLDTKCLVEVINKYKHDICEDELDRALLCTDDLEPFIKYKYPILRLRYLSEDKDIPKKLYIMTSILLFHCCASSQTGAVDSDICCRLSKTEQEWILQFCENLSEMDPTINNVDCAIRGAYDMIVNSKQIISAANSSRTDKTLSRSESASKAGLDSNQEIPIKSPTPTLKFKSSVTVMPSVTDTSDTSTDYSEFKAPAFKEELAEDVTIYSVKEISQKEEAADTDEMVENATPLLLTVNLAVPAVDAVPQARAVETLAVPWNSARVPKKRSWMDHHQTSQSRKRTPPFRFNWKRYLGIVSVVMLCIMLVVLISWPFRSKKKGENTYVRKFVDEVGMLSPSTAWQCEKNYCQKVYQPSSSNIYFQSLSRCILLCMGPQLWPHPIGYTYFSKKLVALATNKLEYKFQSVPSETVHQYLAEAFKLFIGDLVRLERIDVKNRNHTEDLVIKKMNIQIDVETDPDPRLRLNTEESYTVKIETMTNQVLITIASPSFCGVRHGLETLGQMILLDQSTGYLITLTNALVKDAPSYKYRGLMVDTARNFIPLPDLMRTIDAMAMCKLNTFHWRITDVTSFPLHIPEFPQLFEYGAYDRSLVYTSDDIKALVHRAGVRGIRVLIEVAAPGPVGRAWSWLPDASCPKKNDNFTCDNILCLRLKVKDTVFDILQAIYSRIIELTKVDDVFHLSNGIFSLSNCYYLIEDREGFLDKALERLKLANKGFLPKLPIVWFTTHLMRDLESRTWDKLGVQMNEWVQNPGDQFLSRFRVVHSSRWDLSCEIKKQRCTKYRTWQEMYAWKSWRNIEVFTIEGGEAVLWTDIVDSGNLDYHIWPRAVAVAERLWSDIAANASANGYTYVRLDAQRWRMLLRGVKVQPVWPLYCSFNPSACIHKLKY